MPASTGADGEGAGIAATGMAGVSAGIAVLAARAADIDDRRGGNRRDARAKRRDVAVAVGMQAARQEDHVAAGRRIDPDAGAGEARVAERADREELAAIRRERAVDVPAQSAHGRHRRRRRARRHPRDRRRREHPRAVQGAAAQQHARKARRGPRPCRTDPACPATPPIRRAVGSCTTPRSGAASGAACTATGPSSSQRSVGAIRGDRPAGGRNPVSRHAERLEDRPAACRRPAARR